MFIEYNPNPEKRNVGMAHLRHLYRGIHRNQEGGPQELLSCLPAKTPLIAVLQAGREQEQSIRYRQSAVLSHAC